MVESGNGGCPGGTLVPFVDVRHFQFCTKRYRYHARIVQSFTCFTCFTRALHAADHLLHRPRRHPTLFAIWHLWVPKGAELTSLRGGLFAPLPAGFRRLWPPLIDRRLVACHWTCKCNRLNGLCHKKGLFHGMPHSYATPLARDAVDVEALRYSALGCWPASWPWFCRAGVWPLVTHSCEVRSLWSLFATLLEHRPAPICFSFVNSGPFLDTLFRLTCFT